MTAQTSSIQEGSLSLISISKEFIWRKAVKFTPFFIILFAIIFTFGVITQIRQLKAEAETNLKDKTALFAQSLLNNLNVEDFRKIKNPEIILKNAVDKILTGDRTFKNIQIALIEKNTIIAEMGLLIPLKLKESLPQAHAFLHSDDVLLGMLFDKYTAYTVLNLKSEGKTLLIANDATAATYLGSKIIRHELFLLMSALSVFTALGIIAFKQASIVKPITKKTVSSTGDQGLKTALDLIPNGVCIWDADDTLVLSNAAFAELHYSKPEDFRTGMPRVEALTRLIGPRQSLMRPQHDEDKQTDIQRMHDGRWLQINTQCTPNGSLVTFVADITDLKEHEFELTAKKNELMTRVYDLDRARGNLEKQKAELAALSDNLRIEKARAIEANEAKSQFLANMSHDLRTPLNHIIGFAETMAMRQMGELSNGLYSEYPEIIHRAGLQLLSQVNDIIDVYKIEKGEMNIVKINTTFDTILDDTLPAIFSHIEKKSQVFIPDIEANVVLNVDPRAMRLILQNLLTNASKFTPDYGKIYLTGKLDGDNFKIIVKDTGIGIEPEMLAKLCKPFVQCENAYVRSYQGSGLGLFIAKSLIQKHGGDLKISSIMNEGTTIVVNVPLITG